MARLSPMRGARVLVAACLAPALALAALPLPPETPVATVVESYHGEYVGDR